MEKISVLISVFNGDKPVWLRECLASLLNQTLMPSQIVVVQDGKIGDELKSIIAEFYHSGLLHIVSYLPNKGLGYALREGLKHCKHELIARIDADDIAHPERFERQANFLAQNHEISVLGSCIVEIDENGEQGKTVAYPKAHEECFSFFRKRDPVAHPAVMFRKKSVESVGSYRSLRKDQDTELWCRIFLGGGRFANLPEPLLFFRRSKDFFLKRSSWSRVKNYFKLRSKVNRKLGFGFEAKIYLFIYCLIMFLPANIKKCFIIIDDQNVISVAFLPRIL